MKKLSKRIWGLDWSNYFPLPLGTSGVIAKNIESTEYFNFIGHYGNLILSQSGRSFPFYSETISDAKSKYFAEISDCFGFFSEGRLIGVYVLSVTDWSTYYVRLCALLPEAEAGFLPHLFLKEVIKILGSFNAVERIEVETSPGNFSVVSLLNRLGFQASGLNLSERWGAIQKFTHHLRPEIQKNFSEHFSLIDLTQKRDIAKKERRSAYEKEIRITL
jgi:hypothetical protein